MAPIPPSRILPRTSYLPSIGPPLALLIARAERSARGACLPKRFSRFGLRPLCRDSRASNITLPCRDRALSKDTPCTKIRRIPASTGHRLRDGRDARTGRRRTKTSTDGGTQTTEAVSAKPNLLSARRNEVLRALEVAWDALRIDRVRTRSAIVALAIAMSILVCLTTLVERGRAATIRSLERAGLMNLYLVDRPLRERSRPAPSLAVDDLHRLQAIAPIRATVGMRVSRRVLTARGAPFPVSLYGVQGPLAAVFHLRVRSGRL